MTKDELLAIRAARVEQHLAIQRVLDEAGLDGYALMKELRAVERTENDAWNQVSHDDRMEIYREDRARVDKLLGPDLLQQMESR